MFCSIILFIPTQLESQILVAQFIPVTLDISYIQDRIRMSGPQTQRLVDGVVHLHVSSTTRRPHQKPDRNVTGFIKASFIMHR